MMSQYSWQCRKNWQWSAPVLGMMAHCVKKITVKSGVVVVKEAYQVVRTVFGSNIAYMPDSLYVYLKSVENSRGYDSSWQQFGCGEGVKNDVCGSTWNSVLHSCIGSNKEIISPTKNGEEGIFVHQRGGDLGNDGEDKGELDNGWESILRKVNWEDVMHDKEIGVLLFLREIASYSRVFESRTVIRIWKDESFHCSWQVWHWRR